MYFEPTCTTHYDVRDVELDVDPPRRPPRRKPPMPAFVKIYGRQICPRRRMKVIAPRPVKSERWAPVRTHKLDASPHRLETAVERDRDAWETDAYEEDACRSDVCTTNARKAVSGESIEELEGGRRTRSRGDKERRAKRQMAELATRLEALKVQACADECRYRKTQHEKGGRSNGASSSASDEMLASYDKGGLIRPNIGRYLVPADEPPAAPKAGTSSSTGQASGAEDDARVDAVVACCDAAVRVQRLEASNAQLRAAICRLNHVCNAKVQAMELEVSKARNIAAVERDFFRRRLAERTRQHELRVDAVRRDGEERFRALKNKMAATATRRDGDTPLSG